RFLGHMERCAVLLHLVDGTGEDVVGAYRTIRAELTAYGQGLTEKPEVVGLNKSDAIPPQELASLRETLETAAGSPVMALSGAAGGGVTEVLHVLKTHVLEARARRSTAMEAAS